ncbi:DUF305 domain-containing protein [Knoellia subterranea]|uniref:DUF305 domain-containing protein n=1 Tax=Knoellia subterranea KCTC 19937 TaxID=1385521 RepID=A0A0A0JLP2_9MICO|nr:DUF305 domain-containing protein [Knoellia subterranea]KGN38013.1 hypothetical protein N803_09515 [Knoellia subterranea KCTC 19937]
MTDALQQDPTTSSRSRGEVIGLSVLLAVASLLAGLILGWGLFGRGGYPLDGSAEAGFARDMSTHHAQAVQMSLIVADRTEDPAIRTFAYDIATSQQGQIGQMFAWLKIWGLSPTGSQPAMAWMGSDHHGATSASGESVPMPGMASESDIARLSAARGVEADRIFLTLMIAHHKGGVQMAEAVLTRSDRDEVVTLAGAMKQAQTAEITTMEQMLAARA